MVRSGGEKGGPAADPLGGARSEANPGARLLETARQMFYEHGYVGSGINEIIARSQTSKKSFYAYFPSKQRLGEAALRVEEQRLHGLLSALFRRYPQDYGRFVTSWARGLKRAARCGDYHGCPFSNTAAQALSEFEGALRDIARDWQEQLRLYLMSCDLRLAVGAAQECSARLLMQYHGAIQMWALSGDLIYFDRFADLARRLPDID